MRRLITLALILCALVALPSRSRTQGRGAEKNLSPNDLNNTSTNSQALARGRLIERVVSLNDATQSYALYLPSRYTPGKRWPILYSLDPLARGEVPVARV